jgi:ribosomal protein L24
MDASNVMLVSKGKTSRVGYKVAKDGAKTRVAKKTGEEI